MVITLHHLQGKLLSPHSGFLLPHRFSTMAFLPSVFIVQAGAAQPVAGVGTCSHRRCIFFCCRHSLQVSDPGAKESFHWLWRPLGQVTPHCSLFNVLCEISLASFHQKASPQLGLGMCGGFPFFFWLGWGVLPAHGSSFMCGTITADVCPSLRGCQFVCLSCLSVSLFRLAFSLLM